MDAESGGSPAGIYLEKSLLPSDPFYQRQTGPPSVYCTRADMAQLSSLIMRHENLHWTKARARAKVLTTERNLEGITQLPGTTTLEDAYKATVDQYGFTVAAANEAVENSLLPVQPNAPKCNMRQ